MIGDVRFVRTDVDWLSIWNCRFFVKSVRDGRVAYISYRTVDFGTILLLATPEFMLGNSVYSNTLEICILVVDCQFRLATNQRETEVTSVMKNH